MNLEFRHALRGIWGWHEVNEICWDMDDDTLNRVFRELRKDQDAVLWVMDVSNDIDLENILNVSLAWDTWEDYDNKVVMLGIWTNWNDVEHKKVSWHKGKQIFKRIIEKAMDGNVSVLVVK